MKVFSFPGGGFAENGYLAVCPGTGHAVAVDPGAATPVMLESLREGGLELGAILLTHAHLDHVEGVAMLKDATGAPIHLHPDALAMYRSVAAQAVAFGVRLTPPPEPDREIRGGDRITFGECVLEVVDAPGHAPGHVIFHAPAAGLALVGDVIFAGSIGRTDLPGGDFRTLMESIRTAILTLPDGTRLLPGHGPETTVAHERRWNPFLVPQYGGELA